MAVVMFKRPPRREPPKTAMRRVDVRPPPSMPEPTSTGASSWLMVLPALGGLGSMALIFTAGGGGTHIAAGVMFGVSALAMAGGSLARVGGDRNRKVDRERRYYQRHLAQHQATGQGCGRRSGRVACSGCIPIPAACCPWSGRPASGNGGPRTRISRRSGWVSVTARPRSICCSSDSKQAQDVDMVSAVSLRRFLRAHETVRALPVAVSLREFGRVTLEGEPAACRRLATAMVLQAIAWHAPTEFRISLCADHSGVQHLGLVEVGSADDRPARTAVAGPVSQRCHRPDGTGRTADRRPGRTTRGRPRTAIRLVDRSHVLVVIDGGRVGDGGQLADANGLQGVTVLDLSGALPAGSSTRHLRLRVSSDAVLRVGVDRLGREIAHPGRRSRRDRAGGGGCHQPSHRRKGHARRGER